MRQSVIVNTYITQRKLSVWHHVTYLKGWYFQYNIFLFKSKVSFDSFFLSYIYKKFLNNFSANYNYAKISNKINTTFLFLQKRLGLKGIFLLLFLFFNLLFSSFFEITKVRVAGRLVKVPNPLMFNKSYRAISKTLAKLIKKQQGLSLAYKFEAELSAFDQEVSCLQNFEKEKIRDLVENRMFGHFRWKYLRMNGNVTRHLP